MASKQLTQLVQGLVQNTPNIPALWQKSDFSWQAIEAEAQAELLLPFLYDRLRHLGVLSAEIAGIWQANYQHNAARNLKLLHTLQTCLVAFENAGIPAIILKGAALAEPLYGNIALRPMRDVDLLVHQSDMANTIEILQNHGFVKILAEVHDGAGIAYENEICLYKQDLFDIYIELHWNLLDSPFYQHKLDVGWLWQTARPIKLGGRSWQALGHEAMVLHMVSHLWLHHQGEGLLWWQEISLYLQEFELDWALLVAKTNEFALISAMQAVFLQLEEEWMVEMPAFFRAQLHALIPTKKEKQVVGWLTTSHRPLAFRFWADIRSHPTFRTQFRYLWRQLFPSATFMTQRYQIKRQSSLPFYYLYRWFIGLRSTLQ